MVYHFKIRTIHINGFCSHSQNDYYANKIDGKNTYVERESRRRRRPKRRRKQNTWKLSINIDVSCFILFYFHFGSKPKKLFVYFQFYCYRFEWKVSSTRNLCITFYVTIDKTFVERNSMEIWINFFGLVFVLEKNVELSVFRETLNLLLLFIIFLLFNFKQKKQQQHYFKWRNSLGIQRLWT